MNLNSVPHVDDADDDGSPQPHSPLHQTRGLGGGLPDLTLLRAPPGLSDGAADGFDDGDADDVATHVDRR